MRTHKIRGMHTRISQQYGEVPPARVLATAHRDSRGVLMYAVYAELSQRPSVSMRESWMPRWAAVEAAPMQKLCPGYFEQLWPAEDKADRTAEHPRT